MKSKLAVFIAGTGKDAGKTTISMGLISHFTKKFPGKVAFMKPLGQKTSFVDGSGVGQDSLLLSNAFNLNISSELSAPFSTGSGAAEKFIQTGEPKDIHRKIQKSFRKLQSAYKLTVVEGTGHPGVGSVFGLSNAKVASQFRIPVIMVLNGGIGSTIDRFSLSITPFEKENVDLLGVIVNKIIPSKFDKVKSILSDWFKERGIPVLGFIPFEDSLSSPSLGVISKELGMDTIFLNSDSELSRISGFIYAFGSREEVLTELERNPGKALIVSKRRNDIIDAVIARKLSGVEVSSPDAMILCGEGGIEDWVKKGCVKAGFPLFETEKSFDKTVKKLQYKVFKVEPEESEKIKRIIDLVERSVDIDLLYSLLSTKRNNESVSKKSMLKSLLKGSLGLIGNIIKKK